VVGIGTGVVGCTVGVVVGTVVGDVVGVVVGVVVGDVVGVVVGAVIGNGAPHAQADNDMPSAWHVCVLMLPSVHAHGKSSFAVHPPLEVSASEPQAIASVDTKQATGPTRAAPCAAPVVHRFSTLTK
jgi:hypothetical protein